MNATCTAMVWRFAKAATVFVVLAFCSGCGSESPYLISKIILLGVLVSLKAQKKLRFSREEKLDPGETPKTEDQLREDRDKGWFIFRRAEKIGKRNSGLSLAELSSRVSDRFKEVEDYLTAKVGPGGPLSGLAEPGGTSLATSSQPFSWKNNFHFDLGNAAMAIVGEVTPNGREVKYLRERLMIIRSIVWRAAGLHDELWQNGGDGPGLVVTKLDEVLDRRLRSIERMKLQINGLSSRITASGGRGPWRDKSRIRVFEYPYFKYRFTDPADLIDPDHLTSNMIWEPFGLVRPPLDVRYDPVALGNLQTRFDQEPNTPSSTWLPLSADTYTRFPSPTIPSLAAALDALFASDFDIWKRAWLFCDHSLAASHLEALHFAMVRQGLGATFDTLVMQMHPTLSGILGGITFDSDGKPRVAEVKNSLWFDGEFKKPEDNGGDPDIGVFDAMLVPYRDLQVGDHVILWNHALYVNVTDGPWRLENSVITGIDTNTDDWDEKQRPIDPAVFMKPVRDHLTFEGFGAVGDYDKYQLELFEAFHGAFEELFRGIPAAPKKVFVAPRSISRGLVVQWSPYSTGISGDPWFIFLPRVSSGAQWPNAEKMQQIVKYSVINGTDRGDNYQPPPINSADLDPTLPPQLRRDLRDGVFFPLYLPAVNGREMNWERYFRLRKFDPDADATLYKMKIKPEHVPGLFARGADQPIQIIRPRVRP